MSYEGRTQPLAQLVAGYVEKIVEIYRVNEEQDDEDYLVCSCFLSAPKFETFKTDDVSLAMQENLVGRTEKLLASFSIHLCRTSHF